MAERGWLQRLSLLLNAAGAVQHPPNRSSFPSHSALSPRHGKPPRTSPSQDTNLREQGQAKASSVQLDLFLQVIKPLLQL